MQTQTSCPPRDHIACLGAGRMGRGIAVVFAYAGYGVSILDVKTRSAAEFESLRIEVVSEISQTLRVLARCGLFDASHIDRIVERVKVCPAQQKRAVLETSTVVFEGFPEILALKRELFAQLSPLVPKEAIIASTTSTILVDDLSPSVEHPERFLNAHWLNPAYLVPLVEISPGAATTGETTARLVGLLEAVGKVPVVCTARPGYIVPRIQGIAMNEAARLVEEGVASAEDIDKALRFGFGFRFSILGLLEFIDWGGGDILFHTSRYLVGALGSDRYAPAQIIERNMDEGRIGLKTGRGFLNYEGLDIEAYREQRLQSFVDRLKSMGLNRPPAL